MRTAQEEQWLDALLDPLFLYFDQSYKLISYSGSPFFYGLRELDSGAPSLGEILPEMIGIDVRFANEFPLITLQNDTTVDIYVRPLDGGFCLMMLRADKAENQLQQWQQNSHNHQLKHQQTELLKKNVEDLNEQLVESSRAKSLFISGMSHEFRTPIMGMLGNIAWVGKQLNDDEDSYQKIKAIEVNATYLLGLVDNLLQQGKISADQITISRKRVSPKRIFHSVLETMLPLAEKRGILLVHEIKMSDELHLLLDDYHIRRILYNLLGNSIKFTDFGSVMLEVDYINSELKFRVVDTGIGIPEEDREKILLPFTRGANVAQRRGIGLGLSYSSEIVKAMGGTLKISTNLGKGTVVSISLPVGVESEVSKQGQDEHRIVPTGQVLLVEDSAEIVSLYSYYFHDAGINLAVVSNGADLHRALNSIAPKILLVDHMLGEEKGTDLVTELRQRGYEGYVVLLTASIDVDHQLEQEAIRAGCDEFIQKPAEVGRLVEKVESRLKHISARTEKNQAPENLVTEYVATFQAKCLRLIDELEKLKQTPGSADQVQPLKIEVHKISGSAGAYGFPDISNVSIELERVINSYEKSGNDELLDKIETGCHRLVREFEHHIV